MALTPQPNSGRPDSLARKKSPDASRTRFLKAAEFSHTLPGHIPTPQRPHPSTECALLSQQEKYSIDNTVYIRLFQHMPGSQWNFARTLPCKLFRRTRFREQHSASRQNEFAISARFTSYSDFRYAVSNLARFSRSATPRSAHNRLDHPC